MSVAPRDDAGSGGEGGSPYTMSSQRVIISTTIIGGFLLLALLIYVLYRKSRRKTGQGSDLPVFHSRKSTSVSASTIDKMSPQSAESALKTPIQTYAPTGMPQSRPEPSFRPMSLNSGAPTAGARTANRFTRRLEAAHLSFHGFWGPPNNSTRHDIFRSEQKSLAPPSYQIPTPTLTAPTMSGLDDYRSVQPSRSTPATRSASFDNIHSNHEFSKSEVRVNTATSPPSPTSMMPVSACTTRDSLAARWSWTNSQAPPTPRLGHEASYTPSARSSLSSLPRLKSIADWVRAQTARTSEAAPPLPFTRHNTSNLKNQAYKPTLIPTPARALTKPRLIRVGSINAISRPSSSSQDQVKPLPAPPVPVAPEVEQQQAKWNQKYIDLVERDNTNKYRLI